MAAELAVDTPACLSTSTLLRIGLNRWSSLRLKDHPHQRPPFGLPYLSWEEERLNLLNALVWASFQLDAPTRRCRRDGRTVSARAGWRIALAA